MQTSLPSLSTLDQTAAVTKTLSRFSHSTTGLGTALGGFLGLLTYLAHGLIPLPTPSRVALAVVPFFWIAVKELLRHRLYLSLGRVTEEWPAAERRTHIGCTIFVAATSVLVAAVVGAKATTPGQWTYVAIALLMPVFTWFFLRTSNEFIVGVFLFCQAAVGIAGHRYELSAWYTLATPIVSVVMIVQGLADHRRFLTARRELHAIRSRVGAPAPQPEGRP